MQKGQNIRLVEKKWDPRERRVSQGRIGGNARYIGIFSMI
jgi:hypothetical protein